MSGSEAFYTFDTNKLIPAVSTWGLAAAALVLLLVGGGMTRRRTRLPQRSLLVWLSWTVLPFVGLESVMATAPDFHAPLF